MEEGHHCSTVDRECRAVAIVCWRVAAFGDSGRAETVDVIFENRTVIIDEEITATGVG